MPAQLVILGIGVRPENKLAVDAGLDVGPRGGIRVNAEMLTSDPDIYAVGDAVEIKDFISGDPTQVPLAGPANRQGRIAAENVFGRRSTYRGTQGTAILGFFNLTAAMTGASEKVLRRTNRPFRKVYIHPAHHAGYYPGAEGMTLKVLFEPESGKLLGAQAVGGAGVDKRIDVIAVAIQAGMTVFDLEEMELSYAPQFGSAKDPVNMAGFVAADCCAAIIHSSMSKRSWRNPPISGRFYLTYAQRRNTQTAICPARSTFPSMNCATAGRSTQGSPHRRLLPSRHARLHRDADPHATRLQRCQRGRRIQDVFVVRSDTLASVR